MSSSKNIENQKNSFLNKNNSNFIEQMYVKFINKDPQLPGSWKKYFLSINEDMEIIAKEINGPSWSPNNKKINLNEIQNFSVKNEKKNLEDISKNDLLKLNRDSIRAVSLIRSYRQRGHLIASLDPLGICLLYTSPSPRDLSTSRMPSSA